MQKTISLLVIISLLFLGSTSCKKEKKSDSQPSGIENSKVNYEVILDGKVLIQNNEGYGYISESINGINSAINVLDKFSMDVSQMNEGINVVNIQDLKVGDTMVVNPYNDNPSIEIVSDFNAKKSYTVKQGKITRDAQNKLSFTATKVDFYNDTSLQQLKTVMTGYLVSDIIKEIGKSDE